MSVLDSLHLSSLPIPNRLLSRIQTGMMTYPPGTSLGLDCTWKADPYSCIYKLPCSIASGWFWPVGSQGNHWRDSESQGGVRASLRPSHCPSGCAPPHRPAVPARRLSPTGSENHPHPHRSSCPFCLTLIITSCCCQSWGDSLPLCGFP